MKSKTRFLIPLILIASILTSGCELIGSIFKAGVWTGTIGVIVVLAIIIFIIGKLFSKNKDA